MRIAVIGGGPGGLYFAALARQLDPTSEITVWERNAADDTFGFGVVFSDETLGGIEHADASIYAAMEREFARWDDIDVHFRGQVHTSGGHGFAAMSRKRLLQILQQRCAGLGVTVHFSAPGPGPRELRRSHDLVIAADGANSMIRTQYADVFGPTLESRRCRYMWLGTDKVFDAFKFYIAETPHGVMQIHGYPYDAGDSTFIVEMTEQVWERAGFDAFADQPAAARRVATRSRSAWSASCSRTCSAAHELIPNNSKWLASPRSATSAGGTSNLVLLGDAAHTAHFSIGSGTKLAMEDALALAACLHEQPDTATALAAYEDERRPVVLSTQRAAQASLEWFENLGQYTGQHPLQFAFNLMTRSRRVTYEQPEAARPGVRRFGGPLVRRARAGRGHGTGQVSPPMFQPFRLRGLTLRNRVVVSPMDMYRGHRRPAQRLPPGPPGQQGTGRGRPGDDRDGLRVGRRPDHPRLHRDLDRRAGRRWRRIADFVHGESGAKVGIQLGHSGRKGSTQADVGGHRRAAAGRQLGRGRPVAAALPAGGQPGPARADARGPGRDQAAVRRAAARAARGRLRPARAALRARLPAVLVHLAADQPAHRRVRRRRWRAGCATRSRCSRAMRAVVAAGPADDACGSRPPTGCDGGITAEDAVQIARAFAAAGADIIDVSTGQVDADEQPAFGRSYQTPFADRIRNEAGLATIAVGVISSWDDVNSILLAGRADLCALGRAHLYDPNWTLHAAAEQEYDGPGAPWPDPWRAGARRPQTGRTDGAKPRLELIRAGETGTAHRRWRPAEDRTVPR